MVKKLSNNNPFKGVDFSEKKEYNLPNGQTGKLVARIDRSQLKPMYDTQHEHHYVRDDEETDDYYAEICIIPNCNLGRLISKH